jgi:hypothetical protein
MTETEDLSNDFLGRKRAFERYRQAHEDVKKARDAKHKARALRYLEFETAVFRMEHSSRWQEGEEPEKIADVMKQEKEELEGKQTHLKEEWHKDDAEEEKVLAVLAEASQELEELTVEPRVEGLKLRFEESKLQATLSTGLVVGLASVSKLLLPAEPAYPWLSGLAYTAFLIALVSSLFEMRKISKYVENVLITSQEEVENSFKAKFKFWVARVRIDR